MPGLFGRRSPLRIIIYLVVIITTFSVLSNYTPIPISTPSIEVPGRKTFGPFLPKSWGPGSHKAPEPTNGTASTSTWYEHWNWLNPFGTSRDYSESRTVLPPLQHRCPVYAYYDKDIKASEQTHVDDAVMLAWRRAWWAAGFHPVILSPSDAKEHGMYQKVITDKRPEKLEYNLLRWLAWERMGTGVLSDFKVLPMPIAEDHVLPFLRRCDFGEKITRFETLGSALFVGSGPVIKSVVANITLWKDIPEDITSPADMAVDLFSVDEQPKSIAYYSWKVVAEKYELLNPAKLPLLINAHLHSHFQAQHPNGINVINPVEPESDLLSLKAVELAQKLAQCPESPLPKSCPPQLTTCKLCDANTPIKVTKAFQNSTSIFTIGGIPHPLTLEGILYNSLIHEISFIRRNSTRDVFLKTVTEGLTAEGAGAMHRAVKLKEVIAAPVGSVNSIWSTVDKVEKGWDMKEVEWFLGFTLPLELKPSPHIRQDEKEQKLQKQILIDAKHALTATSTGLKKLRGAVESWNLGDFEIWKFAAAFEERRKTERAGWANQERTFGKGMSRDE